MMRLRHPAVAASVGRLARVCQQWDLQLLLCFALDSAEQQASGFTCTYSVYQAEARA